MLGHGAVKQASSPCSKGAGLNTAGVFGVFQRPNPAEFRFPGVRKGNWGGKLVPETTQEYGGLLEVKTSFEEVSYLGLYT